MPISQGIDPNVPTTREILTSLVIGRIGVFTGLTGGGATNFDGVDISNLSANFVYQVVYNDEVYDYILTAGVGVESAPDIINPDTGGDFHWVLLGLGSAGAGGGDVSGPATSTDNAVVRWNGTDGDDTNDSGVIIDDSDNVSGINDLDIVGSATVGGDLDVTGDIAVDDVVVGGDLDLSGATITGGTGTGTIVRATAPTITGSTLAGAHLFAEGGYLQPDVTLSADGTFCGYAEAGTAGAALAFGDCVYFAAADSKWELTDADAEATAGPVKIGICVLAAVEDAATLILRWGKVRADAAFPSFTISAPVFIGTTAGDVQVAAPNGTDDVIRCVGHGHTADVLDFFPSSDYIIHV